MEMFALHSTSVIQWWYFDYFIETLWHFNMTQLYGDGCIGRTNLPFTPMTRSIDVEILASCLHYVWLSSLRIWMVIRFVHYDKSAEESDSSKIIITIIDWLFYATCCVFFSYNMLGSSYFWCFTSSSMGQFVVIWDGMHFDFLAQMTDATKNRSSIWFDGLECLIFNMNMCARNDVWWCSACVCGCAYFSKCIHEWNGICKPNANIHMCISACFRMRCSFVEFACVYSCRSYESFVKDKQNFFEKQKQTSFRMANGRWCFHNFSNSRRFNAIHTDNHISVDFPPDCARTVVAGRIFCK